MGNEKNWFSVKEVSLLLGLSGRQVNNFIKDGKLKAEYVDDKYYIDKEHFLKNFPKAKRLEEFKKEYSKLEKEPVELLAEKVRHLQEMLQEKTKQVDFLTAQLHIANEEKSKMLNALSRD